MKPTKLPRNKIPKYHIGRIFLFPILLYLMLVFPVLGFMLLKSFPELKDKNVFKNVVEVDSTGLRSHTGEAEKTAAQFKAGYKTGLDLGKAMAQSNITAQD